MAAGIDMSLNDIIKTSAARSRYYHGRGHGADRRFAVRNPVRTTPYSIPDQWQGQRRHVWRRSMVLDDGAAPQTEIGTKLYISNLDYGVSNADIKLLFSEVGELKRYSIHYDKSGRSKGTAEVVFMRQSDALAAIKKYNNMRLDGKPLQIELVGTSLVTPPAVKPRFQNSLLGGPNDVFVSDQGKVGGSRFHHSFTCGHLSRGRGEVKDHVRKVSFRDPDHDLERYHRRPRGHIGAKGHIRKVSVKDLDEDLERYHLEAMQQNKENEKGNHD